MSDSMETVSFVREPNHGRSTTLILVTYASLHRDACCPNLRHLSFWAAVIIFPEWAALGAVSQLFNAISFRDATGSIGRLDSHFLLPNPGSSL